MRIDYIKISDQPGLEYFTMLINDKLYGYVYQEVDGFWVFRFSKPVTGVLPMEFFEEVFGMLKDLNKDWEEILKKEGELSKNK